MVNMMKIAVFAVILILSVGVKGSFLSGEPKAESPESCNETLAKQNITRQAFAKLVARGIRSLYLEPIRYVFSYRKYIVFNKGRGK
jgi:hypothetical protein